MDAPEKIALRWELGAAVTNGPLMTHPDYTQFVRADLCADPALLAEAVEVLEGVTPGPWAYNSNRDVGPLHTEDDQAFGMICNAVCEVNFDADHLGNARFIAWCREGVPALLARLAAQEAQMKGLEAERDRFEAALGRACLVGGTTYLVERAEVAETALAAEQAKTAKLVALIEEASLMVDTKTLAGKLWDDNAIVAITEAGHA